MILTHSHSSICPRSSYPFYIVLGASEITAKLYCIEYIILGRLRDLQYIFAVIYGTLCLQSAC